MTEAPVAAVFQDLYHVFAPDDPLIDFAVKDKVAPPLFVPHQHETQKESQSRKKAEKQYRSKANTMQWNRYLTLGRYALSGFDFDSAMEDYESDQVKLHCIIWYCYSYHVDRMMECTPHLDAWATRFSQPYLDTNRGSALLLDTLTTTWKTYAKQQSLSETWSQVATKTSKNKQSTKQMTIPFKSAARHGTADKPTTILEEESKESSTETETGGEHRPELTDDDTSEMSDGKKSALMPNSSVPVSDGTHRVTIRWKLSLEAKSIYRQTAELKEEIYKLLNELFKDDDGYLYKWTDSGTETHNHISKMTPTEVRQFICPSLTIIPSQFLAVIPLRFGFTDTTPAKWRNADATRETLSKYKATASISNSSSASGDLVISGYILLKAPMTTHRLRYLQSLRKQLPETTPPFDILLHKHSPTDKLIPHLAVQCGEKHAHALGEALMSILDGVCSPIFIPRYAFDKMSTEEMEELFQTHDAYVKALKWLPLSPFVSNLDTPRTEYHPDGSITQRTTREWAKAIMSLDGKQSARCDVVNGGTDQLSYLLFPPESGEAASAALDIYKKLIKPIKQREAKYCAKVGSTITVQFSKKVIANLDFMRKMSSNMSTASKGSASANPSAAQASNISDLSKSDASSASTVSQASCPPTPAESLRQQYRDREQTTDASTVNTSDSSRSDSASKYDSDRMSTTSAKLRELDKLIQGQKQVHEKNEQQSSDRIAQIERQLHRIHAVETKLDSVQQSMESRLTGFEGRILESMNQQVKSSGDALINMNEKMEKLMIAVESVLQKPAMSPQASETQLSTTDMTESAASRDSSGQTPNYAMAVMRSQQSQETVNAQEHKSPVKKRQKSTRKRPLKEAIRLELEHQKNQRVLTGIHQTLDEEEEWRSQYDRPAQMDFADITTDLESRYNEHDDDATPPSPGRGSQE